MIDSEMRDDERPWALMFTDPNTENAVRNVFCTHCDQRIGDTLVTDTALKLVTAH